MLGRWLNPEERSAIPPGIVKEWYAWLDANLDPGHYDSYKDRREGSVTNGEFICDTYCPPEILAKLG